MKEYRTLSNFKEYNQAKGIKFGEYYDLEAEPSLTDPSQAMEVKDIIANFTRGAAVRVLRPQKFGEVIPDEGQVPSPFNQIEARLHRMDRIEKVQAAQYAKEVGEAAQKSADQKTAKIKAAQKAKQDAAKAAQDAAKAASKENPKDAE